jgi:hypothetical protein
MSSDGLLEIFLELQSKILDGYRIIENDLRADRPQVVGGIRIPLHKEGSVELVKEDTKEEVKEETVAEEKPSKEDILAKIEYVSSKAEAKKLAKEAGFKVPSNVNTKDKIVAFIVDRLDQE